MKRIEIADNRLSKAVVLLSGGIDSSTCLFIARSMNYSVYALTLKYGQRHLREVESAKRVAEAAGVDGHLLLDLDLSLIGGSALTSFMSVPKGDGEKRSNGIPITYVPARNTIFLSLALAYAEVLGAFDVFIGANQVDFSGYPDCRGEYLEAYERMANLALKATVEGKGRLKIHAPLLFMTKGEIIRRAVSLGLDLSLTHSCYDPYPDGGACGRCDSCVIRKKGFKEAGIEDPTPYGPP